MAVRNVVRAGASACLGVGLVLCGGAAIASADPAGDNPGSGRADQGAAADSRAGNPDPGSAANPRSQGDAQAGDTTAGRDAADGATPAAGSAGKSNGNGAAGGPAGAPDRSPVPDRITDRVSDAVNPTLPDQASPVAKAAVDNALDKTSGAAAKTGPTLPDQASPVAKAAVDNAGPVGVASAVSAADPGPAAAAAPGSGSVEAQTAATGSGPTDLVSLIWTSLVNAAGTSANTTNKSPVPTVSVSAPTALLPADALAVSLTVGADSPAPAPSADALTPQLLSDISYATAPADRPARTSGTGLLAYLATQISLGVREALRNVSVTELALAALPGLVGLLFFFASGVGLGRRQARFGFALQSTGAMRFAAPGPLGVVRSGSLVAVRVRETSRPGRARLTAVTNAA